MYIFFVSGNKYSSYVDGSHFRTAVGFNNDELILLTSDEKLSIHQLSEICKNEGMKNAINCDGGGSCHLQQNDIIYKKSIRKNASWLLVYLNKGDENMNKIKSINIHAGHGIKGSKSIGAYSLLCESTENRRVVEAIKKYLKLGGVENIYDCTVDYPKNQSDCINQIVRKCNENKVDLDVSIHFNAGANNRGGNGRTTGTEAYVYSTNSSSYPFAKDIVENISKLGFKNRGVKTSTRLGVLRNTKNPAVLVECCFVDDLDDVNLYDVEKMGRAIAEGILGTQINSKEQLQNEADEKYGVKVFTFSNKEKAENFQQLLKDEFNAYSEIVKL